MKGLTERQNEVLEYIAETVRDRGYPPTIREIGNALGIRSTNGVNDHLKALERKGFINRSGSKSRAIMVTALPGEAGVPADSTDEPSLAAGLHGLVGSGVSANRVPAELARETLSIPVLGRIAAGLPIEAIEEADEHVQVDPSLLRTRSSAPIFALRVQGESMIGDGIFDGDLIFIRRQAEARNGEIVAVMVDGSATVKRYYRDGARIRLEPSNPSMSPIWVSAADARETAVLGKVVGVYRQLD